MFFWCKGNNFIPIGKYFLWVLFIHHSACLLMHKCDPFYTKLDYLLIHLLICFQINSLCKCKNIKGLAYLGICLVCEEEARAIWKMIFIFSTPPPVFLVHHSILILTNNYNILTSLNISFNVQKVG